MAGRRSVRQVNQYARYVSGNLAYDYDALERERRRQAERERRAYEEERRAREAARPAPRARTAAAPKRRERQRVSPLVLLGFAAVAGLVVMLIMSYAQLTAVSGSVVRMQKQLGALQEEHVALLAKYERTFDLASVKEAAEAAGMAKPSASQVYYVDLSAPNSVVLYRNTDGNVLSRVFTSLGQDVVSMVEYFK